MRAIRSVMTAAGAVFVAAGIALGQPEVRYVVPAAVPRYALVMGVENYDYLDRVENALNDADAMQSALIRAGFSVRYVPQPKRPDDVYDYVKELVALGGDKRSPVIFLVFFAGHGFQDSTFNYIVPADANPASLIRDSVPVVSILNSVATHEAGLAIFLFDACRTNVPLRETADGAAAANPGFAAIPSRQDVFLGLATAFGAAARSAASVGDSNSPYTSGLITYIPKRGISFARVMEEVRSHVRRLTHNQQSPTEVKDANIGEFFLLPADRQLKAEEETWLSVLTTGRRDCVEDFIIKHPGSRFLRSALDWRVSADEQLIYDRSVPCPVTEPSPDR